MRNLINAWLLATALLLPAPAIAANVSTPGAIASLPIPDNTAHRYLQPVDMVAMGDDKTFQILVGVVPTLEPKAVLTDLLNAFNAVQYISQIKMEKVAGANVASVHVKNQSSDWLMVISKPELSLFVRVQDSQDALKHKAYIGRLIKQVRFAPASHPPLVIGSYTTSSSYDGGYAGGISSYSESSVHLQQDGVFSTSGYVGITGDGVSGLSQGGQDRGWWQVRGNRILAFEPPTDFYNYRFEAFRNGLHVYNESDKQLLWVRK